MNEEQLSYVLEACLLSYNNNDLVSIKSYGIPERLAKIGLELSNYLKNIEVGDNED